MTPKWLRFALIVSVALNVMVVAAVVGALVSGGTASERSDPRGPRGVGPTGPPEIGMLARNLEGPQRRAFRQRMREDRALREGIQRIRAGRSALLEALRAQPYSPEALDTALSQQRRVQSELADRGLQALGEVIAEMSDAERATFADRLEAMTRRRGGQRSGSN